MGGGGWGGGGIKRERREHEEGFHGGGSRGCEIVRACRCVLSYVRNVMVC